MKAMGFAALSTILAVYSDASASVREDEREVGRPDTSRLTAALGWGMFVAASGDLVTTEWGLGRGACREANPLMTHRPVRIGTHAAVPAVMWWATDRLEKKGQRRLARVARIAVIAGYGYALAHNLRVLSRTK